MACKRDRSNPELNVLATAYLKACEQMCKDHVFYKDLNQNINALYHESDRRDSKHFKKEVMEPIKKHI